MKDRVPLYPGRVKLTPVSGQENVYDMVRADEPTQEGDPLNKSTFLTDSTASFFGMDSAAVPNDIFNILKNVSLIDNSEETYKATDVLGNIIGGFTNIQTGSYVGTGGYGSGNPTVINVPNNSKILIIIDGNPGNTSYANSPAIVPIWFLTSQYERIGTIYPSSVNPSTDISNPVSAIGVFAKINGTEFSMYNGEGAKRQYNEASTTYYYLVIS